LGAQFLHHASTDKQIDLPASNCGGSEMDSHDRRCTRSLDSIVFNIDRIIFRSPFRLRYGAATEGPRQSQNEEQSEEKPDSILKSPPLSLKFKVLANGNLVRHFRDGIADLF
jgi:hypothetical protein